MFGFVNFNFVRGQFINGFILAGIDFRRVDKVVFDFEGRVDGLEVGNIFALDLIFIIPLFQDSLNADYMYIADVIGDVDEHDPFFESIQLGNLLEEVNQGNC